MDKQMVKWTYWLGLACAAIALVIRCLQVLGFYVSDYLPMWIRIGYMSFYKAAFLLFAIAIATATTMAARNKE